MTENIYARMEKAALEFREAEKAGDELVMRLLSFAELLSEWQAIGFEGCYAGEQISTPGATRKVRFGEMPTLEDFYRAKQRWLAARNEVRGTLMAMTAEQRAIALRTHSDLEIE